MLKLKIMSWNVNGIRAVLQKDFLKSINKINPDVLCLQETKAHPDQVDKILDEYPHHYWNSAKKKGYSGTAIFSKIKPVSVTCGIGVLEHDTEGRVLTIELDDFYLVNCYTPNSQRGLTRLKYRMTWEDAFKKYLHKLDKLKPVILCGDLNVAHNEIDLKNPSTNKTTKSKPGNAGFTDQEREKMTVLLDEGFADTFRSLYPDKIEYTWWSYMFNARNNNVGWRIDYFIVSKRFIKHIKDSLILNDIMGSDHCPILLELK